MAGARFTVLQSVGLLLCVRSSLQSDTCGVGSSDIPTVGRRITDGVEATKGEFPWQVGLRSFGSTFCSGVLIAKEWVLTSARCFNGHYLPNTWNVILGDYDRLHQDGTELHVLVKNIVIHGGFTKDPYTNDLAMVQLVQYNHDKEYEPLCLPDPNIDLGGADCSIAGWGATDKGKDLTSKLRKLSMKVVQRSRCPLPSNDNSSAYLCAVGNSHNGGPCTGDTGASLQCRQGQHWVAAGIVFDTYGCDTNSNTTGLFTSVKSYVPWIQKTTKMLV